MNRTTSLPVRFVLFSVFVLSGVAAARAETNAARIAALESITANELQSHVDYLADDALSGREAGTAGGRAAAEYLVQQLEALGLEGAGPDGTFYQPFRHGYRNVLARLEGRDPELAKETVILGAHYDHVGRGSRKTSLGRIGQIHNGADDNASGTSGILELAEAFCSLPEPPRRTLLFAFWDAEEKGLLGSKHWAANPTVDRHKVVAAINLDMIGRLRHDRLSLFGTRTAYGYRRLVASNNADSDLQIDFSWTMAGNADHYPFYLREIPVLFLHTGIHDQYHRETDDADLINSTGMARVVHMLFGVTYELAEVQACPAFRLACREESPPDSASVDEGTGAIPQRLGVAWDPQTDADDGIEITSITPGSVADAAGLRPGDRVLELAGHAIHSGEDLAGAVISAANPVRLVLKPRDDENPRELTVELAGKPLRLGVTWEVDEAEPGTVVLKHVLPGSAAARAGLRAGDRIYQVAGRDFSDDAQFADLVTTLPGPLDLLVERQGRLVDIVVRFGSDAE